MNKKIKIFNIEIDNLKMHEAISQLVEWVDNNARTNKYVVTPNVDHIVKLRKLKSFKEAYDKASMIVTDGKPVVLASKLLNKKITQTVPGSDLVPALFDYYQLHNNKKPVKVFLLGAMPGVADEAKRKIHAKWSNVTIVGISSPPLGFDSSEDLSRTICSEVAACHADVVVLGVGSPKQEVWASKYAQYLNSNVVLCVGATIDFLAGEKRRAPLWLRKLGLEWLHRLTTEPKRLFKRYLVDAIIFPLIVIKEFLTFRKY